MIETPAQTKSIFEFDRATFETKFPYRGFIVKHQLRGHPLLALPSLEDLAHRLPEGKVEYRSGKVGYSVEMKSYPGTGLSMADTMRRLTEVPAWVALRNVEVIPEYRELLHGLLAEVRAQFAGLDCEHLVNDMHRPYGFVFISSPGTVTPCHVDDEHSFLMQVQGKKQIAMWDFEDRTVMTEEQAESMLELSHDDSYDYYLPYKEEFLPRATMFDLNAGEALHFPFGAPHWVQNGNEISISFSIAFRTPLAERQAVVHYMNKRLRRLGVRPTPPFHSDWRDALKVKTFHTARRAAHMLRRHQAEC